MGQVHGSVRQLDESHLDVIDNYGLLSPHFLTTMSLARSDMTTSLPATSVGGFSVGGRTYGGAAAATGASGALMAAPSYSPGWQSLHDYLLYVFGQVSDKKWIRYEVDVTANLCTPVSVKKQLSLTIVGTQRVPWQILSTEQPGKVKRILQGGLVGTTPDSLLSWPSGATRIDQLGSVMQVVVEWFNTVNKSLLVGPENAIVMRIFVPRATDWGTPGAWAQWVETRAEKDLNTFLDLLQSASSETGIVLRMERAQIVVLDQQNTMYQRALADAIGACSSQPGRAADVAVLQQKQLLLQQLQPTLQRLKAGGGGAYIQGKDID